MAGVLPRLTKPGRSSACTAPDAFIAHRYPVDRRQHPKGIVMNYFRYGLLVSILFGACSGVALGEAKEVRIAQQYGFSYLQLIYMRKYELLEKHAADAGLGDIDVTWTKFAGGNVMNDALLSGSLDFASGGLAPPIKLWAKTRNNDLDVRMVASMTSAPLFLNTNDPDIESIEDFKQGDQIALPAVKVSFQATLLAMAASQQLGPEKADSLNRLTVSMSHPDGMTALLTGQITGHFTSPPYQYMELEDPKVHTVVSSFDIMGGPHSFTVLWTTAKFKNQNPKLYQAFIDALEEATNMINSDKRAAAKVYVEEVNSKEPVDSIYQMLSKPNFEFTMVPLNVGKFADFMYESDMIDVKPESWKDLFFENAHDLGGS